MTFIKYKCAVENSIIDGGLFNHFLFMLYNIMN